MQEYVEGVRLTRTGDADALDEATEALVSRAGGRVGLAGLLERLDRKGRRSWAPGLATRWAFTWDREDRRTPRWWPQGISTCADAHPAHVGDRDLLVTTWYAKDLGDGHQGSRVSVVDLATHRYAHVLLVVPRLVEGELRIDPLKIHAGGVAWCGPWLHVAATARGLYTCHLDDVVRVPDALADTDTFGYRHLLPVRFAYRASNDDDHERLRYSFLSYDRESSPPRVVAGEYARGQQTRRLVTYPVDPETMLLEEHEDGHARPLMLDERGVGQAQGAVVARGSYAVTTSHGPWMPGSVHVGRPGQWARRRWAFPMGPEDIAYWPERDELWSLSEHPRRRWVFGVPRSRLAGHARGDA